MAIETDTMALERAIEIGLLPVEDVKAGGGRDAYAVFFIYMRLNSDGTFAAYRYYFEGTNKPIDPSTDPQISNSLGFYAKDMALYARPSTPNDGRYQYHGAGLEDFQFPSRYAYCIFYMDDVNWKYLLDKQGRPVITFNDKKNGKSYHKHPYAFGSPVLLALDMPIKGTNDTDERHAAVMINRMRNDKNKELVKGEEETYNFDLWMRVRYAHSTNGLTLVVDPGGTNLGPPKDP
jgi:hypothetical protein